MQVTRNAFARRSTRDGAIFVCPHSTNLSAKRGRSRKWCDTSKIRDELSDLASKALSPSAVRDELRIHSCRNSEVKADEDEKKNPVSNIFFAKNSRKEENRGADILIRELWARGMDCIIDVVRIIDVDAKSNRSKDPAKVLAAHEREKRRKRNIWRLVFTNVVTFLRL